MLPTARYTTAGNRHQGDGTHGQGRQTGPGQDDRPSTKTSLTLPSADASDLRVCGRAEKDYERCLTWIKPSFLWMMYRCGWATKEGQETVLAVEISREGFDWALDNAELSHYVRGVHPDRASWQRSLRRSPARVQWDPERDLHLNPLPHRSLQLGLTGEAARRYADEWTVSIRDVTPLARQVHELLRAGRTDAATALLPCESLYPTGTVPVPMRVGPEGRP
ncbi:DUF4291 domain-containing protein [Streptomyces sp. NPDC051286]|uniref:DUF4291 domain-containing protein n=1 Tax=Streptomyces sp. NPDC051286 TaxID=3365647 RepID=UPI0037B3F007